MQTTPQVHKKKCTYIYKNIYYLQHTTYSRRKMSFYDLGTKRCDSNGKKYTHGSVAKAHNYISNIMFAFDIYMSN